jgi:hypothetical protein
MTGGDDPKGWQLNMQFSFVGDAEPDMPSFTDDITAAVEHVLADKGFTATGSGYGMAPVSASTMQ